MTSKPPLSKKALTIAALVFLSIILYTNPLKWTYRNNFELITTDQPYGFKPVNCWFYPDPKWPKN